jgi:hypothetical protein
MWTVPCAQVLHTILPIRGSVVKAGLGWSLALRPCIMLVARLASRLLYFLFSVATHGLVALAALATVVPLVLGASSGGCD